MCNNDHFWLSLLLIGGFVLLDFIPQIREHKRELPAVCFSACVYAFALAIAFAAGCAVKMDAAMAVFSPLLSLYRSWGGDIKW